MTLLAAAEVLEEFEAEGRIRVTEVAGTSAGSIAAFAFAKEGSTELVRARMKSAASAVIDHFSYTPSKVGLFWRIYRGKPVFEEVKLHDFLRQTFADKPESRPRLSDARIPIHIRVSDIRNGRTHTYHRQDEVGLETALIDSCAIPLAFRTHVSKSPYADGGITSNLVDNEVFDEPDGKILAFSFPQGEPYQFSDAATYLLSLASTAIDASVSDSREKIKAKGGYVCDLPNHFGTFDFRNALATGLSDEHFAATKRSIREQVNQALQHFERASSRLDLDNDLQRVQAFTSRLINRIVAQYPFGVSHCSITCVATSLDPKSNGRGSVRDQQIKDLQIVAKGTHLHTFRVGIGKREAYELGKDIRWDIRDANGRKLSATHEVIESMQEGHVVWHSCFVLDEPLPSELAPIKVKLITSHVGLMDNLVGKGGTEWMRAVCSQDDDVALHDFVLAYPRAFGPLVMTDLLENRHRATEAPSDIEAMSSRWHSGTRMTKSELEQYVNDNLNLSDYAYIGWRCVNVPPKAYAGALIERSENR